VGLEATNDPSIEWLDPRCKVWAEIHNRHVRWFVVDIVTREVVKEEADLMALFTSKSRIHLFNI